VVLTPGAEKSTTGVSLTALTESVQSDAAIPPGRKCFLLMKRCGHCYLPLDDILSPRAEDMIDNIGEESHADGEMQGPNPRSFPTMKTGFQKFELKLQKSIIRQ
jgi:hypothetical protein